MFNILRKLAWGTFFLTGAAVFYLVAPAAIHSVDNVEILEKNDGQLLVDWNLSKQFLDDHPYLSRIALQASQVGVSLRQGYSQRVEYQHQWALSNEQVQRLTAPAKGIRTILMWKCDEGEPSVLLSSKMVGTITEKDPSPGVVWEFNLSSQGGNVTTEAVHHLPWWYPAVFTVGAESQSRQKEIARVFPELDKECSPAPGNPITFAQVLQEIPGLGTLHDWEKPNTAMPTTVTSPLIGAGSPLVLSKFPENETVGSRLDIELHTGPNTSVQPLQDSYARIVDLLSTKATLLGESRIYDQGYLSRAARFKTQDGEVSVGFAEHVQSTHSHAQNEFHHGFSINFYSDKKPK